MLGTSVALFALLLFARAGITGTQGGLVRTAIRLLLSCYYDFAYSAGLTLFFLALLWTVRNRPGAARIVSRAFTAAAFLSVFAALINREIVPIFGKPFTYQWLYYSDFLQGQDAKNAVRWMLDLRLILSWVAALLGFLAAAWILRRLLGALASRIRSRRLFLFWTGTLAAYFLFAGVYFARSGAGWNLSQLGNPVVVFARSAWMAPRIASLLEMATPVGPEDFTPPPPAPTRPADGAPKARNVIVVVLESVPAEYLESYGGSFAVMPELTRRRPSSVLFSNIYANSPATESSMASLLFSLYPWLSYKSLSREQPSLAFPSIGSELAGRGYRTAFFNAADLRYADADAFLANRGFQRVEDYRSLRCGGPVYRPHDTRFEFLEGADDACMFDALLSWASEPSPQPFFGLLWTMMTHHPYFAAHPEKDFGVSNPNLNRFLNALHHDDALLGRVLRTLEERHLAESTLVVVVGDHGESFGRHQHEGHGSKIYEEDLHVPLFLIQPGRFHGETVDSIGGIIDIAPTILDALGIPPPPVWQGRSLFRADRPPRTYFFAPHSDFLVGLREGNLHYIDNVWQNRFEVYDVAKDPLEEHDLAPGMPAQVRQAEQRLAAWVQYQDRLYRDLFARQASPGPATPHPAN